MLFLYPSCLVVYTKDMSKQSKVLELDSGTALAYNDIMRWGVTYGYFTQRVYRVHINISITRFHGIEAKSSEIYVRMVSHVMERGETEWWGSLNKPCY